MTIREIAEFVKTGYLVREGVKEGNPAEMLGLKDIDDFGRLDLLHSSTICLPCPEKHALKDGEILLSSRGRFVATTFRAGGDKRFFIVPSSFFRISLRNDCGMLPEYVALYLNSSDGQREIGKFRNPGTVFALNIKDIEDLALPRISLAEQEKCVRLAQTFFNWQVLQKRQAELRAKLFNLTVKKIIQHG